MFLAGLTLSLAPGLVVSEVSTYTVTGAGPGESVGLVGGVAGLGSGPCPPFLGGRCFHVVGPLQRIGSAVADANGSATIQFTAPPTDGIRLATQAFVRRGPGGANTVFSNARVDEVFPPWVSGLNARPANPTCLAPPDPPAFDGTASVVRAFPALTFFLPTKMAQPPGDPGTWWIAEQPGTILRFDNDDGVMTSDLVLDIQALVSTSSDETGLLSFAFHPEFEVNGEVFLFYTREQGARDFLEIARYVSLDGGLTLDPTPLDILFTLETVGQIHFGGNLGFGPDGYLYLGVGDGGKLASENGQDTFTLLGKVLRVDVDAAIPYGIPADNPFADGIAGLAEIYAYGIRQPWRWSFDRLTGDLWLGDVGFSTSEEISIIERGGNYGWDLQEGSVCNTDPNCDTVPGLIDPVLTFGHVGATAVIGGYVYRGTEIPNLVGTYLFADHFTPELWGIQYDVNGVPSQFVAATAPGVDTTSFAEDTDGELYMLSLDGTIHRIEPPAVLPPVDDFPTLLSETGCFDLLDPTVPVEAMIPFEPNSELWSDGATKRRWLAMPDGATIDSDALGDLDLPIGSVLAKEFTVAGQRIETRLLVRHDDGLWAGYTYAWDAAETEATLVDGALTVPTPIGEWRIPSRAECLQCHTAVAGFTLGLEESQLNRELEYPSTGLFANQLFTLDAVGLLTDALENTPDQLPALPDPTTALQSPAARSYLHVNCAHCHQPGGPGLGDIDLRFTETEGNGCDLATAPVEGDLGVPGALVVDPGSSATSVLSLRMNATDTNRMPPLASVVVDPLGTSLVDGWIDDMAPCPP
jgi:uncharacterized repeat protein (TIGR03806 family)